jgi:hypothetical protein
MTENTEAVAEEEPEEDSANISRLREMALRGDDYREVIEDFTYYGLEGDLYVRPLTDPEFLPIASFLEERLGLDPEEAQEAMEEEKDGQGNISAEQFDKEFVAIMHQAAATGIDTTQGIAEGEDEEGVAEILKMLQGGKSLVIAERVLEISSDAEKAEQFRRDGGGE